MGSASPCCVRSGPRLRTTNNISVRVRIVVRTLSDVRTFDVTRTRTFDAAADVTRDVT